MIEPNLVIIEKEDLDIVEYFGGGIDMEHWRKSYAFYMEKMKEPHISIIMCNAPFKDPWRPEESKNYYSFMRYTLGLCLLGDGYYMIEPYELYRFAEHYYVLYYDEFDLDLGWPTQDMQKLPDSNVWVRFFQKGVSIVNLNGTNITVWDSDLKAGATLKSIAVGDRSAMGGHDLMDDGQAKSGSPFLFAQEGLEEVFSGCDFNPWAVIRYIKNDVVVLQGDA